MSPYDRWVARNPCETPEEHELRLLEFFIFILETEGERMRESLMETLARNARNVAAARERREALLAILATRRSGAPETRGSGP